LIFKNMAEKFRLNKFIAHTGLCSRRKAGDLVKEGKIKLNGQVETNPAVEVTDEDRIEYKGKPLKREEKEVYILMNKPRGVITSLSDEHERKTVIDVLGRDVKERVYPVGRLDFNTTGLLLLTNDGALSHQLTHPSFEVKKVYELELDRPLSEGDFQKIKKGLMLEDGPIKVDGLSKNADKNHVGIEIHSGRNRIVRRIFEHLDYTILKLDRVLFAGLTKKNLPRGKYRFLTRKEIILLKHFNKK